MLGHTGYERGRLGWRAPAAHSTQRVCGGAAGTIWDITIGGVGAGGGVGTDGSVGANVGVGVGVASASHFVKPDNSRNPTDGKNEMTIETLNSQIESRRPRNQVNQEVQNASFSHNHHKNGPQPLVRSAPPLPRALWITSAPREIPPPHSQRLSTLGASRCH